MPRKKNTRGGEESSSSEVGSVGKGKGKDIERDLREGAKREIEAEARTERERVEQEGLRWRRSATENKEYAMPGSLPGLNLA